MQVSRIIVRGAAVLGLVLAATLGSLVAAPSFAGAQTDGYDGYDGYEGYDGYDGADCPPGYEGYDGYEGYEGCDAEDDADAGAGGEVAAPPATGGVGGSGGSLPMTGAPTLLAGALVIAGVGIAIRRFATV